MSKSRPRMLRRPPRGGFVGPFLASSLLDVITDAQGAEVADRMARTAGLTSPIAANEPLREGRAAALHRAVHEMHSADAFPILKLAGEAAGRTMLADHLSRRAQKLLRNAPWTVSAWMLSRALSQQAWLFCGSGTFTVADGMRFEIRGNPLIRGQRSTHPICTFHASMFETMYRAIVDPRLVCAETTCEAKGDELCRFAFGLLGEEMPRDSDQLYPP